jgi:hypothetical protein
MRAVILGASALSLCLAGGLGVLHAANSPAAASSPGIVTIAVLRGDGVLIPIATRSGSKWANTWPVPAKAADVPLALDGIPKRWWGKPGATTTWHAWQIDGTTTDVATERPTWYLAHCQQGIGLKTALTARPPLPPPTTQPYPKLGLASTAPLPFRRIQPIDQSDKVWIQVADKVGEAISEAEDGMNGIPRMGVGFVPAHPMPAAERAKVSTRIESLYRLDHGSGRALYYVEATKRYGMPPLPADGRTKAPTPKRGCSLMTFGNGFFVIGADGVVPTPTLDVRTSSCDYDTVSLILPLAAIGDDAEQVWIGQLTGWDYEAYAGFRWDAAQNRIVDVFRIHGGDCANRDE